LADVVARGRASARAIRYKDGVQALARKLIEWIEIPSVSGSEGDYGDALARELERMGLDVERQELAPGRFNVLARRGEPRVVLCSHLDTVPPYFGAREDRERVHGRGACDAKGQAVAQLAAAERLLARGEERIGFLYTVAEETDRAGAALANERLSAPWRPAYTLVGEPTDNRYVRAHKGLFKARLRARGVLAHSSQPAGPSAVHELVRCCARLLDADWGAHPVLGAGNVNVGVIGGGVAANVVAGEAEASLMVRCVEPAEVVRARLERELSEHVTLECASRNYGPVEFVVPEGADATVVAFGTDAPHLPRWGQPLLIGPGSILDAHTEHEGIDKRELERGVELIERTLRELLARL
jgi:acetylornithine deacetylase